MTNQRSEIDMIWTCGEKDRRRYNNDRPNMEDENECMAYIAK